MGDIDGMTDLSNAGVFMGKELGFAPCTPEACMAILEHYGIDCTGKKAVVIGRSLVVGKPVGIMRSLRVLVLMKTLRLAAWRAALTHTAPHPASLSKD